jgi:hypothetical protein
MKRVKPIKEIVINHLDNPDGLIHLQRAYNHLFTLAQRNLDAKNFPQAKAIKETNNN